MRILNEQKPMHLFTWDILLILKRDAPQMGHEHEIGILQYCI